MAAASEHELPHIVQTELESFLLGGEARFTREDLVERTGVSLDRARELWMALGFPVAADPTAAMYTESDARALREVTQLVEDGVIGTQMQVQIARSIGQALARLAEWQVDVLNAQLLPALAELGPEPDPKRVAEVSREVADRIIPALENLQQFAWRRHLAAAMSRSLAAAEAGRDHTDPRSLVVGFADMVGYTRLTRHLDRDELSDLLEAFESTATRIVTRNGGWVIKNVGDEVMFAIEDPGAAAELALELQEATGDSDATPELRIGMASGPVLTRFGDLYGSVVNTAARLTGVARPGTVLIDDALAKLLDENPDYSFRHLRGVRVRGISHLGAHVLRRTTRKPSSAA
jgi:adenylate cyclase